VDLSLGAVCREIGLVGWDYTTVVRVVIVIVKFSLALAKTSKEQSEEARTFNFGMYACPIQSRRLTEPFVTV